MARRVEGVVIALLSVIAFAHLLRLACGVEVRIGGTTLPMWVSVIGLLGPLALALLLWWSHRGRGR